MGTWGTAIYSCDIAEDVRDACNIIFAYFDVSEGNAKLFSAFSDIINQHYIDNEYASFWYALADWQWKHGMLNEDIKEKTISLLENNAGLDEWDYADIAKRKKVLERLKEQLAQSQPVLKKPRVKVAKPKHALGDIIIFKAANYDESVLCDKWKITSFIPPLFFKSSRFRNSQHKGVNGYDAKGKYMALLCVGTVKERHSEYVEELFDEHSLYVWYDYLLSEKPSLNELSSCGFLPYVYWNWKDFNKKITESVDWGYEFTLACEKFKQCKEYDAMFKVNDFSEVERYKRLISQKKYSSDYYGGFTVDSMFSIMFAEKNRATLIGEEYDNLLKFEFQAPELLTPREVDRNLKKYFKEIQNQIEL